MNWSINNWNKRFVHQARWTKEFRHHLFHQNDFSKSRNILELGCGTGVIINDTLEQTDASVFGLDIDMNFLSFGQTNFPQVNFIQADAYSIPFKNNYFDITLCHYFLLWVADPVKVLCEAKRVTHSGGNVIAFAEPDYEYRIDYPPGLVELGKMQTDALVKQGANPFVGRQLAEIFTQAGLYIQECGIFGGRWTKPNFNNDDSEWEVLEMDLKSSLSNFEYLKNIDSDASNKGYRILFVPTFYTWGKVIE